MASIIIRTAIIYLVLSIAMRMMGKRQIGELDVSELVSTLLISEIVSIPIDDTDIPLFTALIAVAFVFAVEIILSTIKNRSEKMKRAVEGTPSYIIYKGRLNQSLLRENRISVDELLSEMRVQGIYDIDDIYYGIVECSGSLSLIKKSDAPVAHAVIIDGEKINSTIEHQGIDRRIIDNALKKQGLTIDDVFLMTVNENGQTRIIPKEEKK